VPEFDVNTPSIARVYDYWLGGTDNFAADRELGDMMLALYPPTADIVRENKQFLTHAVTWVAEQGIGQFIDLGAGLPTSPSTLETARAVIPYARVACVDNDPVVLNHLRALVGKGIDLEAPACLMMGSLLHFFPVDVGHDMLERYVAALAPGSYVILSVGRGVGELSERFISTYRDGGPPLYYYSAADVTGLLSSLEVVPPGIAEARAWRPGWAEPPSVAPRAGDIVAFVARQR